MTEPLITIVIPTFRRPDSLSRLLKSVLDDVKHRDDVRIVIADNDVNESARPTVSQVIKLTETPIVYKVAPNPGVSNARNVGMSDVKSQFVLFLDDDMEVVPPYLDPLMEAQASLKSTITFAPAIASLPDGKESWTQWLEPLFSRTFDGSTRIVTSTLGTGGCLIDLDGMSLPSPIFDPALNEVGGEDDAFFNHLIAQGGTVGWCADTKALEHVPPHRATRAYLWSRHFAFGQTPTRHAADQGPSGLFSIIKWMIVGLGQTVIYGAGFVFLSILGRPASIGFLGRLAQGVGKIFWWDTLSPRLYGNKAR